MEVLKAIQERRSIRAFGPDPVPEELLRKLVEAGIWAPSGGNAQTWRFIVVTDPVGVRQVTMLSPGLSGDPPAIIAVCQDLAEAERKGSTQARDILTLMDSAMAAQNIMLAAHAEGLGTCAICSFHQAGIQKLLDLPPHIVPQILVSVGWPQHIPPPPRRNFAVVWFQEYGEHE